MLLMLTMRHVLGVILVFGIRRINEPFNLINQLSHRYWFSQELIDAVEIPCETNKKAYEREHKLSQPIYNQLFHLVNKTKNNLIKVVNWDLKK